MRELNQQEKELTNKNLLKNKEELNLLQQNLEYNLDLIKKQTQLREFDNKWREYLQSQKDRDDQKVIQIINDEIDNRKFLIKTSEDQLANGVEEKPNPLID